MISCKNLSPGRKNKIQKNLDGQESESLKKIKSNDYPEIFEPPIEPEPSEDDKPANHLFNVLRLIGGTFVKVVENGSGLVEKVANAAEAVADALNSWVDFLKNILSL